ncbi:MAG TPA: response regulator [Leptolyngbyaceae cyanobacterium M33_DOE_097]|uniref:histidine kinase n=1 Tax=Oscillatoriales cyanobacterium SpSt-418 TaxID=2282169 RepID=A0A7C3KC35_9CYAN|nr:response regulator [Leptolyngbyaceae cyanobacterium M33_DOE_097]
MSPIASENTILIIDDSPDNLRVLSKTLSIHGYTVRCVTNAAMAFVSIQSVPPSLILLDIRMPEMNGYEVCQQLKQNPTMQDIPVIFLSALDDVKDIVKAFQVGGVDYIIKPFQTEEVLARIHNQLTIQKLKQQLSSQNQALLQEIDERKKTEQALCQEIQRRILIEASLQDAKNVAEAASYVKSEFLAQMSHELRTPLNIILGYTALLKGDEILSAEHCEYVTTIEDSAYRLLKLLNNTLSITHSKSTQLSLTLREFDLHLLLNSAIALWQPKALQKGIQVECQWVADIPQYIQADESKIRQILMNLLSNATHITEKGFILFKVGIEAQPSMTTNDSAYLVFELQCSGVKLTSDETEFLFFFSPETEANQKLFQELGLSFLMIRQLAQLMGGDAIFNNGSGQESVMKVYFSVKILDSSSSIVQFPAGSSHNPVLSVLDEGILTLDALQVVMSDDWLVQLHQAAVKGFDQKILNLLQKIPATHASLSKTLELWTRNFQFDQIVEITERLMQ